MKNKTTVYAFIISGVLSMAGYSATTIPLNNASFEQRTGYNGGGTSLVPSWQSSTSTFGNVSNVTASFTSGLSGNNAIQINGGIAQLTSETFVEGETYTITVDIGRALLATAPNGNGAQISFRNAANSANIGSVFVTNTSINALGGTFQPFTFNYVAKASDAGNPVHIRITDFNEGPASGTYFDNVSLTTTVPEPSASLLMFAFAGLAASRRCR